MSRILETTFSVLSCESSLCIINDYSLNSKLTMIFNKSICCIVGLFGGITDKYDLGSLRQI